MVVDVDEVSRTKLLPLFEKPNGFEVMMKGLKVEREFNGRGVVVVVVGVSRTELLSELPIPNGFEVTIIDLNGRPRASRR